MSLYSGFWLNRDGAVITFSDSATLHIHDIVHNPEKFGLTKDQIKAVEDKYPDEPLSKYPEGSVRVELIRLVSEISGWVRMRAYRDRLSATVFQLDEKTKEAITKFCKDLVSGYLKNNIPRLNFTLMSQHTPIKITATKGIGNTIEQTISEVAKDKLFESNIIFTEILTPGEFTKRVNK